MTEDRFLRPWSEKDFFLPRNALQRHTFRHLNSSVEKENTGTLLKAKNVNKSHNASHKFPPPPPLGGPTLSSGSPFKMKP